MGTDIWVSEKLENHLFLNYFFFQAEDGIRDRDG